MFEIRTCINPRSGMTLKKYLIPNTILMIGPEKLSQTVRVGVGACSTTP